MRKAYPAVLDSLDALRTDADAFCAENRIDADSVFALNLCLEEVFSNSAIYGCGLSPDKKIEVSLSAAGGKIVAEVSDSAPPFNPLKQVPPPDLKADVYSRSVGGLGIFLVKEYMDDVSYRRKNGKNILSMKRKIAGGGGAQ